MYKVGSTIVKKKHVCCCRECYLLFHAETKVTVTKDPSIVVLDGDERKSRKETQDLVINF